MTAIEDSLLKAARTHQNTLMSNWMDIVSKVVNDMSLVSGTGTAGFIAKWLDTSTIENSVIFELAGKIGIGTITPATELDIAGTITATGYLGDGSGLSGVLIADNNLSDLTNIPQARSNLGLGALAVLNQIDLAVNVTGILQPANGGTGNGAFTTGSIPFIGTSGQYLQNNTHLFWDNTNFQLLTSLGTAALPVYGFIGDTNTGMWSPVADTLAWSTAGTERMRMSSTGRLGLFGQTNPLYPLDIGDNSTVTILRINGSSGTNGGAAFGLSLSGANNLWFGNYSAIIGGAFDSSMLFYNGNASNALFYTSGVERMRIDSSGNVGIGTTSPTVKMDIVGNAVIGTGTRSEGNVRCLTLQGATAYGQLSIISTVADGEASYACKATNIPNGSAGHWLFGSSIAALANKFSIGNGGSWGQLVIDTSGNVGIATASPVNKLDVVGSIGFGAPVTKTADFSLAATENDIICNKAGTLTITLPAASSWPGRRVTIRTITANTVVSASSNVVPAAGGAAGTAILAATAGKSALLISDATNWQIQLSN